MININKENFVKVCEKSLSMSEACKDLKLHFNTFKSYAIKFGCYKPNKAGKGISKKSTNKIPLIDILEGKYPQYQTYKLKNRLISENIKELKCECCGLTKWNDKPIPLELHHIDGNRTNHKIENLQILCPNCHAQTDTYRAKNIR